MPGQSRMVMTFHAIDVESSNSNRDNISSIGIVHLRDGAITDKRDTVVDVDDFGFTFRVGTVTRHEWNGEHGRKLRNLRSATLEAPDVRADERYRVNDVLGVGDNPGFPIGQVSIEADTGQ